MTTNYPVIISQSNDLIEEKLLKILAIAHITGGLILSSLIFIEPVHSTVLQMIYGSNAVTLSSSPAQQTIFWISILGPTIASWGLLFYFVVEHYFNQPGRYTFKIMVASILVLAPLDSALCLYVGIYPGVAANALVMLVFLILFYRVKNL